MKPKDICEQAFSIVFALLVGGTLFIPTDLHAASVSYSNFVPSFGSATGYSNNYNLGNGGEAYLHLTNTNYTVSYNSNGSVPDGSTVNVGNTITFTPVFSNSNIVWNGTGAYSDSPYGYFDSAPGACSDYFPIGGGGAGDDSYLTMVVGTPSVSVSGSGMSCVGLTCTVTQAGPISATVNFSATDINAMWGFVTNTPGPNAPATVCQDLGSSGSDYIPAQQIIHNFTGAGASATVNLNISGVFQRFQKVSHNVALSLALFMNDLFGTAIAEE